MNARIFHYTSIESLALILKTRSLRFSRLDGVDDVREAQNHSGIDFGKFFFISCWTEEPVESIPQWNMYSRDMQGVRIEVPIFPFQSVALRPKEGWRGIVSDGDVLSPIPFESLWGDSHFIVPLFLNRDHFAGPVEYVSDVRGRYDESIKREVKGRHVSLKIERLPKLPRFKSEEWAFQKEYRFSLFVLPSLPVPTEGTDLAEFFQRVGSHMSSSFINNLDPGISYIDVPIDPSAIRNMVVRTGPLCSLGGQACVEAIVGHFAPEAQVERSALFGAIRARAGGGE